MHFLVARKHERIYGGSHAVEEIRNNLENWSFCTVQEVTGEKGNFTKARS